MRYTAILLHSDDQFLQTDIERLNAYNYHVQGICDTADDAFVLCRSCTPDVLLMWDTTVGDNYLPLLNRINTELPQPPVTIFITISQNTNGEKFLNNGGDAALEAPVDYSLCNDQILRFLRLHRHPRSPLSPGSAYRHYTKKHLITMKMPTKLCGFIYIMDAVEFLSQDPSLSSNLIQGLYTKIGDLYQEPYTNIGRCIRTAIERTFQSGDLYHLAHYFHDIIREQTGKPQNGDFIKALCDIVSAEIQCDLKKESAVSDTSV